MLRRLFFGLCSVLSACASAPDTAVTYYLPKVTLDLSVTSTVTCGEANEPLIVTSVAVMPTYARDDSKPRTVRTSSLDGPFSNVELTFTFTQDGRLTGVNSTQTGQGTEIVKSLVTLGSNIASTLRSGRRAAAGSSEAACLFVRNLSKDKGIPVTLTWHETFEQPIVQQELRPAADSAVAYAAVKPLLGTLCFQTQKGPQPPARVLYEGTPGSVIMLPAVQPASYSLKVLRLPPGGSADCSHLRGEGQEIWAGVQPVPQRGSDYGIPIPKAAVFGTQTVVLALADDGSVTSLKYGKNSGLAGAADAASAIAAELKRPSASDKAAEVKAEADLIAQQQRLAKCRTSPAACT